MTVDRDKLAYRLFQEALKCAQGKRAAFLDAECGDDTVLRAEVGALLAADALARSSLDVPHQSDATVTANGSHVSTMLPKEIGKYHIKRVIASGGMGTVYEAVQEHPRRTVAVKVMKHGIASRSAMRRFEYESQVLARLRHPGIAQVYEAGTHDDGNGSVPFFAMEYIPNAKPITLYANEKKLGTRERLDLFGKVCDALNHGHQKGIIHRDLKPSNILVDSHGQPRIIDFGVARATDSDMAVTTLQTDVGQLIGTMQYMSPEQCEADPHDLDIRSDVYALGVVLYELLCHKLPYDVSKVAVYEATRMVREHQPTRLSTIDRTFRGDVETIVFKSLEKERERRYRSAAELADDINRFLSGEAIIARPPSIVYQLRVFSRRNRAFFAAVSAAFVLLAAGMIVSTSLYLRMKDAQHQTAIEAANAEFRARTARTEVSRTLVELHELMPLYRQAYELAYFADESRRAAYPQATLEDAAAWLERLFIEWFPDRAAQEDQRADEAFEHEEMAGLLNDFVESVRCATDVGDSRYISLVDWIRSSQDRLELVVDESKGHRFEFGAPLAQPDALQIFRLAPGTLITRHTVKLLIATAWVHHAAGDYARAAETIDAARTIAHHYGNAPTAIHRLVEFASLTLAYRAFRKMAVDATISDTLPAAYVTWLSNDPPAFPVDLSLTNEGRQCRQIVDHVFSHEAADAPPRLNIQRFRESLWEGTEIPIEMHEALLSLHYDSTMETIERTVNHLKSLQNSSFRELVHAQREEEAAYGDNVLVKTYFPGLTRFLYLRREVIMSRDATIATLALCRYRAAYGRWPDSLEEATPNPMHAEYFDAPFVYRVVDEYPLLYALGDDFEDNGGRPREYPIFLPDDSEKWDYVLVAPPRHIAAFNTDEQERARAVALVRRAKQRVSDPYVANYQVIADAETLLTCEPEDLRDPAAGLALALRAVETDGENAYYLDILALAYFMNGDVAKAIEIQKRAISVLLPEKRSRRTELEANLAKYRAALSGGDETTDLPER